MEKTTNKYINLKGSSLLKLAHYINPDDTHVALVYFTLPEVLVLLSKMLPGDDVSAYIFSDAVIRGSNKFTTKWDPQDLDTLMEILRLGFVAGIFYEKRRASNRPRTNNRSGNASKQQIPNVRGKLS